MPPSERDNSTSRTETLLRLRISENGRERRVVLGSDANLVGSDPDCEVALGDPSVSRRHATIFVEDDGSVSVIDWESKNGTWVDGRRVRRRTLFDPEQPLRFGQVAATVERVTASETEAAVVLTSTETSTYAPKQVPPTTITRTPLHGLLLERLPAALARMRKGESTTAVAQVLGAMLVEAFSTDRVEIVEDRSGSRASLFSAGGTLETTQDPIEETIDGISVRVGSKRGARPGDRELLEMVATLIDLTTGQAALLSQKHEAGKQRADPPDPPTLDARVREIYRQAASVARGEISVMLLGESGTGKEVLARFIHANSPRASGPFVAVNCAALPRDLIEAELFGIEKGVATGVAERSGKFEQASGGTLLLDEIGDMRAETQVSILRVLQEGTVHRVGGKQARPADVRILAATNRDIEQLLDEGAFRLDLYHRIADWEVRLPALRERPRDIANLAAFFLEAASRERGVRARGISKAALARLVAYPWPGNIRQLEREMNRAVLFLEDGDLLESTHLSDALLEEHPGPDATLKERLEHFEREEIRKALRAHQGSAKRAAETLGIATSTFYRRAKELGVGKEV